LIFDASLIKMNKQKPKQNQMNYKQFLETKIKKASQSGFDIQESKLNKMLFPFQKFIVRRMLKQGKGAIFADCGLGKTPMQLEWANQIAKHTKKPVLILTPLAVSGQTIEEGTKFHIPVKRYNGTDFPIQISNYEQIENIDCSKFAGIVLDESSILKNFEGETKKRIIETFADTDYKLCCTATPSPNDLMELGTHAEFLNVMGRNEMLSTYFVHDGGETSKWRIKGHAVNEFWDWVSSWALMLALPSDIGFSDEGYILPELNIDEFKVTTPKRDNGKLFNDVAVNTINFNSELRLTILERTSQVESIVNNSDESFVIWVKHNGEGDLLKKRIVDSVQVKGSDTPEVKEKYLLGFAHDEYKILITKAKIAQFGLNFQNSHNQIFASLDFSFESLYQCIRRMYRFGQKHKVNIYLVTTDTMQNVIESIRQKQKQFQEMQNQMSIATQRNYLKTNKQLKTMDTNRIEESENFKMILGDCVQSIKTIPGQSIDFSIFSPPFADLYTYSSHLEDMGNSKDYNEFVIHFGFLVKELQRVIQPGRLIAVHCMDLPIQKGKEGIIGLRSFSDMIINSFNENGFIYHSRVTIWKDPVIEMQRTKALGLLHKQVKKDSTMSRVGLPDYLLVFRDRRVNEKPVKTDIPVDLWQKWASPIWYDINYSNTLQKDSARENEDEKHICPLQLDTIERSILLWSNEGDTVLSPFAGIGSEGYQAIKNNRKFIGIELKESYYQQAVNNLRNAEEEKTQLRMFA
jgi:DNA modification methylase